MLLEQQVYLPAKGSMTLAQALNQSLGERCTPGEPLRDRPLKVFVISPVQRGGLVALDAEKNLPRVLPEIGFEGLRLCTGAAQFFLPPLVHGEHRGLAVVQKGPTYSGDGYAPRGSGRLQAEQRSRQHRPIA